MQEIEFLIDWPPSVNSMYTNRMYKEPLEGGLKLKGRRLTDQARGYKKYVADLIFYKFRNLTFGKNEIEATFFTAPPLDKRRRDSQNNEKIVCDAIEDSGIIVDDRQVVKRHFTPLPPSGDGYWIVNLKPYDRSSDKDIIDTYLKKLHLIIK